MSRSNSPFSWQCRRVSLCVPVKCVNERQICVFFYVCRPHIHNPCCLMQFTICFCPIIGGIKSVKHFSVSLLTCRETVLNSDLQEKRAQLLLTCLSSFSGWVVFSSFTFKSAVVRVMLGDKTTCKLENKKNESKCFNRSIIG